MIFFNCCVLFLLHSEECLQQLYDDTDEDYGDDFEKFQFGLNPKTNSLVSLRLSMAAISQKMGP